MFCTSNLEFYYQQKNEIRHQLILRVAVVLTNRIFQLYINRETAIVVYAIIHWGKTNFCRHFKMVVGPRLLWEISPLLLIPYLAVILSVFAYFVHQKYQIRIRLRNVPYSTIFNIDLDKVKKNLGIESTICNFILVLLILELSTNISWGICQFLNSDLNINAYSDNKTIPMQNQTAVNNRIKNFNRFALFLSCFPPMAFSSILPVLCLFLIVLRRAFINLPYKIWVRRYTVYISVRFVAMLVMSLFLETYFILHVMFLPLTLFDICIYISSSRAFYVLLKGRRDEALYHSPRNEYLRKKGIASQFFYTQIITYFGLFALLTNYTYLALDGLNNIRTYLNLFGYTSPYPFPNYDTYINHFLSIMEMMSFGLLDSYSFITNLIVLLYIVLKLFIRRRKLNQVNSWITRPLMERYRCTLEEEKRTQERPPFIQAIRSNFVY